MAGLKTLLGLYPKTNDYENKRKQLEDEYRTLNEFENSQELARYIELEQLLKSEEYKLVQKELLGLRYKDSEEYKKETELKQLKKDKALKLYYKTKDSESLASYERMQASNSLDKFEELRSFVESGEFINYKASVKGKEFKESEQFAKFQEFNQLKKDSQIKAYYKFKASKQLQNYTTIKDSDKLKKFEELKEYVVSQDFIDRKKYLTLSPKTRWQQSEAYKQEEEYNKLKGSDKIKWYFKTKGDKKFDWFTTWETTFEDNFDKGNLDREKWLTKYYWADELSQESYSLADEKHCITDGKNLDFNAGILKITTRKEQAEGKVWNPEIGFTPNTFDYTSGLISTGKSFRQKYGLFEAKIKVSGNQNLLNAFWMVGEKTLPHVDVFNALKKCSLGLQTENSTHKKSMGRNKFASDFYIVSLEWTAEKMVWKINGLEVKTITTNIPQEEMYLNFSAGLYDDINNGLPGSMEIDWVRCYSHK